VTPPTDKPGFLADNCGTQEPLSDSTAARSVATSWSSMVCAESASSTSGDAPVVVVGDSGAADPGAA
jgi:hypothetical protein